MRQRLIIKGLKSSLVNCPRSRLEQLTPEAFNEVTTKELERLQDKLECLVQIIKNNRTIRANKQQDILMAHGIEEEYKTRLIESLHKGNMNGALR